MKNFIKAVKEINRTLNFITVFDILLNSAIFFLVVYFLLSLVNLFPMFAIVPVVVYFVLRLAVKSRRDKRKMVESKYEPLKEKLRTAVDNIREENPVVNELEDDVMHDLKHVGLSSFIQTKQVMLKIFSVIILSFAIVFATEMGFYIVDLNEFLSNVPDFLDGISRRADNVMLGEINESQGIYGKSKLAVLGNDEIDIRIKPTNYEVNVREGGDVEQKQFDEIFPREVAVEQASAFEEKIPEEQQELVKSYFNKLAGK